MLPISKQTNKTTTKKTKHSRIIELTLFLRMTLSLFHQLALACLQDLGNKRK